MAYKCPMTTALRIRLSDVSVGKAPSTTKYNPEAKKHLPADPCEVFLARLNDFKDTGKQFQQSLFLRLANLPSDASMYHRNYMEYLEACWANHLGIVVSPDILWFTLLNEVATLVRGDAEKYRHLFSTKPDKQVLLVESGGIEMPLGMLVALLRDHVPTDTALFLPEFSTTSVRSRHAMYAAFCDVCSPYYSYMMAACAFPAISVTGTKEDWEFMAAQWRKLGSLFEGAEAWNARVQKTLDACVSQRDDANWWRNLFYLERCGSGGSDVRGWYSEMFRERPRTATASNFPTCVASMEYKNLNVRNGDFKMQDGLFYSYLEGDFMVPDFGYTLHSKIKVEPETYPDWRLREAAQERFLERIAKVQP